MHGLTGWSRDLSVEVAGRGVVAHAGSVALRGTLSDRTGLTGALSSALARRGFTPVHDRGRVLADAAVLNTLQQARTSTTYPALLPASDSSRWVSV